jgi:hypothetical protein
MGTLGRPTQTLLYGLLLAMSAVALGDNGLSVSINNNSTRDLLVTVYDMNTSPATRVLSSQTINGYASLSIHISADDSGMGHLSWTARTPDQDMRRCGSRDKPNLADGDTVNVYADSDCGT